MLPKILDENAFLPVVADKTASSSYDQQAYANLLPMATKALSKIIPKAKPVPYPPPHPFEGSKMSPTEIQKAAKTTLIPFGIQLLNHVAKETKNKIEDEANSVMRKITYPEPLINEAMNRYLSKF